MTSKFKKYIWIGRELICSLLFPSRCLVCDEILEPEEKEKGIHSACSSKLYPICGAVCMHCGRPIGDENSTLQKNKYKISNDIKASGNEWNFMPGREYCHDCIQKGYTKHSFIAQAKALYLYKGKIKKTMYRFKYNNKREYAAFFAQKAVEQYTTWMKRTGVQVIIPVPMYRSKKRQRGYNQAETFAKELARLWGIPCDATIVKRVINTTPQKGLGEKQRKNNLKNAFHVEENVVQYSCAMVVDDIYTTGSTAEAVARELIKRGTRQVYLLTICIGEEM